MFGQAEWREKKNRTRRALGTTMTNSVPQSRLALAARLTILHSVFDFIHGSQWAGNKCKCLLTVSFVKYGVNSRPLEIACVQFNVDYLAENACCCNKSLIRFRIVGVSVSVEFIRVLVPLVRIIWSKIENERKNLLLSAAPKIWAKKTKEEVISAPNGNERVNHFLCYHFFFFLLLRTGLSVISVVWHLLGENVQRN